MAWAIKQRGLRPLDKWVLFLLAYRDNHEPPHGCFPSLNTIAADCGMSRSAVQESIGRLRAAGKIAITARKSGAASSSNFYSFPEVYRDAAHPSPSGGTRVPRGGTPLYRDAVPKGVSNRNGKERHNRAPVGAAPSLFEANAGCGPRADIGTSLCERWFSMDETLIPSPALSRLMQREFLSRADLTTEQRAWAEDMVRRGLPDARAKNPAADEAVSLGVAATA